MGSEMCIRDRNEYSALAAGCLLCLWLPGPVRLRGAPGPFIEEFVFRGVLLRSAARHIHFWASAVVQSLIFVAILGSTQSGK